MILRILAFVFMALVFLGIAIAVDIKDWFFWTQENYGRLTAYGAVTGFAIVFAMVIRIAIKLEEKTR